MFIDLINNNPVNTMTPKTITLIDFNIYKMKFIPFIIIFILAICQGCNGTNKEETNVGKKIETSYSPHDTIINNNLFVDFDGMEPGLIIPVPSNYKFKKIDPRGGDFVVYYIFPDDSTLRNSASMGIYFGYAPGFSRNPAQNNKEISIIAEKKIEWSVTPDKLHYETITKDIFNVPDSGYCIGTDEIKTHIFINGINKDSVQKLKRIAEGISLDYYKRNHRTLNYLNNVNRLEYLFGRPAKIETFTLEDKNLTGFRKRFYVRSKNKESSSIDEHQQLIEYTWEDQNRYVVFWFTKMPQLVELKDSLFIWKN
jgi:hypothetical protein